MSDSDTTTICMGIDLSLALFETVFLPTVTLARITYVAKFTFSGS